jgi:hypothetical protein
VDFGGLLVIALIWVFFKMVGRSREERAQTSPRRPLPPGPAPGRDPTQREGSALERLLRELERTMNESQAGPAGRRAPVPLRPPEAVKDAERPEVSAEAESLETDARRPERATVDQDEQAEQVIARRAASAAARSGPLTRADHQAFDRQIRQEPADHTAVRGPTPQQLRDAVIWREILGPPVSEREP